MATWVAVGTNAAGTATVMYSRDNGKLWDVVATPLDGGECLGLAYNGSVFVAGGFNADDSITICTSTDLLTWVARPNLFDGNYAVPFWVPELGLFVALGATNDSLHAVASSPDGITWTGRSTANAAVDSRGGNSLVWVPSLGILVAVFGNLLADPKVAITTNLSAWSTAPGFAGMNGGPKSVAEHGGLILAAATFADGMGAFLGTLASSADGLNWTLVPTALNGTNGAAGEGIFWDSLNSQWIHVGQELMTASPFFRHMIATSPNGTAWTARTTPIDNVNGVVKVVAGGGGKVMAGGFSATGIVLMESTDGHSWSAVPTPFDAVNGSEIDGLYFFDFVAPTPPQPGYHIKIVEQDGMGGFTIIATVNAVSFTSPPTKVLNGIGSMGFQLGVDDPVLADLATDWLKREVQLYRGSSTVPWWWGVPMQPSKSIGSRVYTIQCAEVIPWLLSRRNFGKTARHNLLDNPGFETAVATPWSTTGVDTATVENTDVILGAWAIDLVEASSAPDASVQQTFTYVASGIGDLVPIAGWYKIITFTGPAIGNRGLYVEFRVGSVLQDLRYTIIDGSTPQGKWSKAELPPEKTIWIPPNVTADINVRGYAVEGEIEWDAFFAGVMESTSTLLTGSDIATFAAAIVNHAQDNAYDKDDLDILTSTPATGYLVTMSFQHAEHANIWNGIKELIDRDEGIDVGWTYTASTRTFVTYDRTAGAFGKGADRTALNLALGGLYVVDYGNNRDGNEASNYVTMLGTGNGPAREEGGFTDNTKFGGRNFELVAAAPPEATINSLAARAAKLGRVKSRPGVIDLQLRPGLLIEGAGALDTGDKVTLPAYDPMVDSGDHRVVGLSLNPQTDVLTVGVAPL